MHVANTLQQETQQVTGQTAACTIRYLAAGAGVEHKPRRDRRHADGHAARRPPHILWAPATNPSGCEWLIATCLLQCAPPMADTARQPPHIFCKV